MSDRDRRQSHREGRSHSPGPDRERRQSHKEGRSRSPAPGPAPVVAPVAVKVDENAMMKPLTDIYSVDREKVKATKMRKLCGVHYLEYFVLLICARPVLYY